MSVTVKSTTPEEKVVYLNRIIGENCSDVDSEIMPSGLIVKIDCSSGQKDLQSDARIILNFDGSWDIEHEYDDGRDPYDRDMTEPYEP